MVDSSLTDNPDRFPRLKEVFLESDGVREKYEIESALSASRGWIIKFTGVDDRNQAEELKGYYLEIESSELPELEDDSYYIFELIGLDVFDTDGNSLGELMEVLQYPANDVYVVKGEEGRIMIPAIRDIVKKIDMDNRRMEVKLLPGLSFE